MMRPCPGWRIEIDSMPAEIDYPEKDHSRNRKRGPEKGEGPGFPGEARKTGKGTYGPES
jgi:hypothetical protein